ncbi:MAG: CPBP family intramembrane metalloprotease [Anaerolineae bacterium]|nr:CPBP family intramembrane metalloprotease [Anaerolineae bacterium]
MLAKLKTWLLSEQGILVTGAILTLIVLAESIFPPWAPYFVVYAIAAIYVPLALKTYAFGGFKAVLRSHWRLIAGILVVSIIWDQAIMTWLYDRVLVTVGLSGDPFYSLSAAIDELANGAAHKFGISYDTSLMLYAFFIVIWAPVGEELFYRGYMQGVLRQTRSFKVAALVSATFFGVRHATHLFFLWPDVPIVAATVWVMSTFVFGLLMSYLYEKTRSLYPLMVIHAAVNIVGIILSG